MSETQSIPFFFSGEFTHTVDKAGRVTIPSQWRLKGDGQCYLGIPMPDGTVRVLPPREIDRVQSVIAEKSKLSDLSRHRALTAVFAKSDSLECDKQGRVVLPERMRRHVGVKGKAVLTGGMNTFTIWNPKAYAAYAASESSADAELLTNLSELGV